MNAIQELGEVVAVENKMERALAFARWASRWMEVGVVQNDVDLELAEHVEQAGGNRVAWRYEDDLIAVEALCRMLARTRSLYQLEDLGVVDSAQIQAKAYRSQLRVAFLRGEPRVEPAPAPVVLFTQKAARA